MPPSATSTRPPREIPPIDPRIRARRIEVQRQTGRRRLQRLVDLAALVVVALGFAGALWTPLLDVDEVLVTGAAHTGAALVLERAGVAPGDPLVTVDLVSVGERIAELPWVAEVHLERGVDGHVSLEVRERTAVASLGLGATAMLVDRAGRVLGPAGDRPVGGPFVVLTGMGPAPAVGAYLPAAADALALAAEVAAVAPGSLATLDIAGRTGTLVQGGEVRFGDGRQLDAKARSLRTVLDQVDLTCLAVLDLRLPGSPVLTREQACS